MKMVKNLLRLDKKGVSQMIGYVLLIIIAISLSIAVFAFLKLYVPPASPECPEEVKLTIEAYTCEETSPGNGQFALTVTLANKGLLRVYGVYIRLGKPGRIYKPLINTGERSGEVWGDLFFLGLDVDGKPMEGYLNPYLSAVKPSVTSPPNTRQYIYNETDYESGWSGGERELEIEPIYLGEEDDNQASVCETAIVKKRITCE